MLFIEDKIDDNLYIGRTQYDAEEIDSVVYIESKDMYDAGDFVKVKIQNAYEYDLKGIIIDEIQ